MTALKSYTGFSMVVLFSYQLNKAYLFCWNVDLTLFYLNVELTFNKVIKFLNANNRANNRAKTLLFNSSAFSTFYQSALIS